MNRNKNGTIDTLVDRAVARARDPKGLQETSANASSWWAYAYGVDDHDYFEVKVFHYSTEMLYLRHYNHPPSWADNWQLVDFSLGHGSVSDQQGVNRILQSLHMPFYYRRDAKGGGPRIGRTE